MIDIDDRSPSQWSYYDELLKGRRFDKVVEKYPDFRDVIVEKIQSGEIERAVDIRDKLPLITKIGVTVLPPERIPVTLPGHRWMAKGA